MTRPDQMVERLAGLLAKATPGPWRRSGPDGDGTVWVERSTVEPIMMLSGSPHQQDLKDAALIVAVKNALPDLLSRIAALEAARAALREALEQSAADCDDLIRHAANRLEDGEELGSRVWRIALQDIAQEAGENAARARAALLANEAPEVKL